MCFTAFEVTSLICSVPDSGCQSIRDKAWHFEIYLQVKTCYWKAQHLAKLIMWCYLIHCGGIPCPQLWGIPGRELKARRSHPRGVPGASQVVEPHRVLCRSFPVGLVQVTVFVPSGYWHNFSFLPLEWHAFLKFLINDPENSLTVLKLSDINYLDPWILIRSPWPLFKLLFL